MSTKKNIDDIFKNAFENLNEAPPEKVWETIEATLNTNKSHKKTHPFWLVYTSAALVVFGVIGIATLLYNNFNANPIQHSTPVVSQPVENNTNTFEDQVNSSKTENKPDTTVSNVVKAKALQTVNTIPLNNASQPNKAQPKSKKHAKVLLNNQLTTAAKSNISKGQKQVNATTNALTTLSKNRIENTAITFNNKTETGSATRKTNTVFGAAAFIKQPELITDTLVAKITAALQQKNNIVNHNTDSLKQDVTGNTPIKKWQVQAKLAPVVFGSLGKGSSIDQRFVDNATSSPVTFSYGIEAKYTLTSRLHIKTGLQKINTKRTTNNVIAYTTVSATNATENNTLKHVDYDASFTDLSIQNSNFLTLDSTPEFIKTQAIAFASNISQELGFIEVPLELEYHLLKQKFGVTAFTGFSTLFLTHNNVYLDNSIVSILIGEANNVNTTSFTANVGLGFSYKLANTFNINLSPSFKYQINTFTQSAGNFNPYLITINAGLGVSF